MTKLQMTIQEILNTTDHRPWGLPSNPWRYYQEWNNAVFLHWQVSVDNLRKWVPSDIEIDLFDGKAWVSVVAFTMERIRPKYLPSFPPISNFDEINIRTYGKYKGKTGVYFLSIEGGTKISCQIAKSLSELPYRYSKMTRQENHYRSFNNTYRDHLEIIYRVGEMAHDKSELDSWLTERYALFQDSGDTINTFEIHHVEWSIFTLELDHSTVDYPRFKNLIKGKPDLVHYSPGVQVLAWGRKSGAKNNTLIF